MYSNKFKKMEYIDIKFENRISIDYLTIYLLLLSFVSLVISSKYDMPAIVMLYKIDYI
jgi:hypothetical protein